MKISKKTLLLLSLAVVALSACSPQPPAVPVQMVQKSITVHQFDKVHPDIYLEKETPEVIQNGRYTLINSTPIGGQKHLLKQWASLNLRFKPGAYTVQNGMEALLKDTGYSLCRYAKDEATRYLFNRPLPKVHHAFNKMQLQDALQMLAGESFDLVADTQKREVCFEPREQHIKFITVPMKTVNNAVPKVKNSFDSRGRAVSAVTTHPTARIEMKKAEAKQ